MDLNDFQALKDAQEILVRSGAVSYCAFRLVESYKKGIEHVAGLGLPHEGSLVELLDYQAQPLRRLFERLNLGDIDHLIGST